MTVQLRKLKDKYSNWLDIYLPSDSTFSGVLVAATDTTLAVPAGFNVAVFAFTGDVYVADDVVATVPTGAITAVEGELNPTAWDVTGITTLHFISSGTPSVQISFFVAPNLYPT